MMRAATTHSTLEVRGERQTASQKPFLERDGTEARDIPPAGERAGAGLGRRRRSRPPLPWRLPRSRFNRRPRRRAWTAWRPTQPPTQATTAHRVKQRSQSAARRCARASTMRARESFPVGQGRPASGRLDGHGRHWPAGRPGDRRPQVGRQVLLRGDRDDWRQSGDRSRAINRRLPKLRRRSGRGPGGILGR